MSGLHRCTSTDDKAGLRLRDNGRLYFLVSVFLCVILAAGPFSRILYNDGTDTETLEQPEQPLGEVSFTGINLTNVEAALRSFREALEVKYGLTNLESSTFASPHGDETRRLLEEALFSGRNITIAISGSSSTAGAGAGKENIWPVKLKQWLDSIFQLAGVSARVLLKNTAQGATDSFWAGLCLENYIDPDADIVGWEYSMNDGYYFSDSFMQWLVQFFVGSVDRALKRVHRVPLIFIYTWKVPATFPPSPECQQTQEVVVRSIGATRELVTASAADLINSQPTLTSSDVLADKHHPSAFVHAMISDQITYHYARLVLDVLAARRVADQEVATPASLPTQLPQRHTMGSPQSRESIQRFGFRLHRDPQVGSLSMGPRDSIGRPVRRSHRRTGKAVQVPLGQPANPRNTFWTALRDAPRSCVSEFLPKLGVEPAGMTITAVSVEQARTNPQLVAGELLEGSRIDLKQGFAVPQCDKGALELSAAADASYLVGLAVTTFTGRFFKTIFPASMKLRVTDAVTQTPLAVIEAMKNTTVVRRFKFSPQFWYGPARCPVLVCTNEISLSVVLTMGVLLDATSVAGLL